MLSIKRNKLPIHTTVHEFQNHHAKLKRTKCHVRHDFDYMLVNYSEMTDVSRQSRLVVALGLWVGMESELL